MKLALDENLPPALARAIHELLAPYGVCAVALREKFGPGIADRDWIAALHEEGGWSVLTSDRKLRSRPHERAALEQSGLVVFMLAAGLEKEGYWMKAAIIIRRIPDMLAAVKMYQPPSLIELPHRWSQARLCPAGKKG